MGKGGYRENREAKGSCSSCVVVYIMNTDLSSDYRNDDLLYKA